MLEVLGGNRSILWGCMAMSPRTGRPHIVKPKSVKYSIRLDEETEEALLEYCHRHGLKRGEAIRLAIKLLLGGDK